MENGWKIAGWMVVAGTFLGGTVGAEEVESIDAEDEETFVRADADKDGGLTFDEATAAGLSDGSEADRAGWKRLAGEDGRIRRHRFHEMCRKHRRRAGDAHREGVERWQKAYTDEDGYRGERFDRADADGSGGLTRTEAKAEATPLEERLFGGKRFDRADANDDGLMTKGEARRQLDREKEFHRKHKDDAPGKLREKVKHRKN